MATFERDLVIKVPELKCSWFDRVVIRLLQNCSFPKHIAFILDGNRRYARSKQMSLVDGYGRAGQNILRIFHISCEIGVQCFTVYLFSIENFNRPQDEVDDLLELMKQQLSEMIRRIDEIHQRQICIRVYGKVELFPVHIQKLIGQLVLQTEKNRKTNVNICVNEKLLTPDSIDHFTLSSALYSCELSEPDLLVRTSGVRRLSDFLLWQSAFSHILFVDEQWPDYSKYSLFKSMLQYTINWQSIANQRKVHKANVLKWQYAQFVLLKDNVSCSFEKFCAFKKQQIDLLQNHFHQKRIDYFVNLLKQT